MENYNSKQWFISVYWIIRLAIYFVFELEWMFYQLNIAWFNKCDYPDNPLNLGSSKSQTAGKRAYSRDAHFLFFTFLKIHVSVRWFVWLKWLKRWEERNNSK